MNDKPFSDDPELLIAAGVVDNHIDAIDAIVNSHVTDAVVASRLAKIVQDVEYRQAPPSPSVHFAEGRHRRAQPNPFPMEIRGGRPYLQMRSDVVDDCLEMPPLHGRWALLQTVLSGQQPGSNHETRLAVDGNNSTRMVVIKRVAPPAADQDPDRLRRVADRFQMEMHRQSSISSPYVAPVIDSGFAPGFGFFIVTERYACTMADRLKPGPSASLTLGWGLSVIEDVLRGLIDCFEQTGIVHLDIKPSNIALDAGDNVRLIDFGLARPATDGGAGYSSASSGFTAFYAPPEQMLRLPDPGWCTPACDIRAVAATLYEIITGTPPLYATALDAGLISRDGHLSPEGHRFLIKWMNTDRVIPPDQVVQWLPGSVNELIMNWLDPNPLIRGDLRTAIKDLRTIRLSLRDSVALHRPLRVAEPHRGLRHSPANNHDRWVSDVVTCRTGRVEGCRAGRPPP